MPKKPRKIEKRETLEESILWDLENDVNVIIERLQNLPEMYPKFHRFSLYIDGRFNSQEIDIIGYRWETDAEYDKRMLIAKSLEESKARKKAEKEEAEKEEAERAEYERLKKKFDKGK